MCVKNEELCIKNDEFCRLKVPKHMECFLNAAKTPFHLDDHRVNVTVSQPTEGTGLHNVSLAIMTRRRGDHPAAQTPALLGQMKECLYSPFNAQYSSTLPAKIPGNAECLFPRETDIKCTLFNCKAEYVDSSGGPGWDVQYLCASALCVPWAGLELSGLYLK